MECPSLSMRILLVISHPLFYLDPEDRSRDGPGSWGIVHPRTPAGEWVSERTRFFISRLKPWRVELSRKGMVTNGSTPAPVREFPKCGRALIVSCSPASSWQPNLP